MHDIERNVTYISYINKFNSNFNSISPATSATTLPFVPLPGICQICSPDWKRWEAAHCSWVTAKPSVLTAYRSRMRHCPVLASCLSLSSARTLVLVLSGTLSHQLLRQELLEEWAVHVVNHGSVSKSAWNRLVSEPFCGCRQNISKWICQVEGMLQEQRRKPWVLAIQKRSSLFQRHVVVIPHFPSGFLAKE